MKKPSIDCLANFNIILLQHEIIFLTAARAAMDNALKVCRCLSPIIYFGNVSNFLINSGLISPMRCFALVI